MKIRLLLALFLGLLCFSACEVEHVEPAREIEQVQSDSSEEEEESTTSGEDS